MAPDSARYDVNSTVIGVEADAPSTVRDSVVYREQIASFFVIGRDSSLGITAVSDSGYQRPRGREPLPEVAARAATPIRVTVERDPRTQALHITTPPPQCSPAATLVSPLMPAIALQAIRQMQKESPMVRDSLSYSACQTGVVMRYNVRVATDSAVTAVRPADRNLYFSITGSVDADSSRALPMGMRGQLSGTAELTSDHTLRVLPGRLKIILRSDLVFQSSTRTQHLRQLVQTEFTLRP